MWIVTKTGFVSIVQNDKDSNIMRVRARTHQHLAESFPAYASSIIDHDVEPTIEGPPAPMYDYRFHLDVPRIEVQDFLVQAVDGVDYTSHAKEAMSKGDRVFHGILMRVWSAFMQLQETGRRRRNWYGSTPVEPLFHLDDDDDDEDEDDDYDLYADEEDEDNDFEAWLRIQNGLSESGLDI